MVRATTDEERLRRYKAALNKRIPIKEMILFGSRAKGTARPNSDYDLVIISRDFKDVPFRERPMPCMELWDINLFPTGADILCYTPAEFKAKQRTLNVASIAAKEGVKI